MNKVSLEFPYQGPHTKADNLTARTTNNSKTGNVKCGDQKFFCIPCGSNTMTSSHFKRHLTSKKHKDTENEYFAELNSVNQSLARENESLLNNFEVSELKNIIMEEKYERLVKQLEEKETKIDNLTNQIMKINEKITK